MVLTKDGHGLPLKKLRLREAGHPLPDRRGWKATREMVRELNGHNENDLILFLVSGGGSALFCSPVPGITLRQKKTLTRALLFSGASIEEMNAVRKHLSLVKGGQSARLSYPARVIVLGLSDVVGDPWEVIASGPFYPDPSTFTDVKAILIKYRLWNSLPPAVRSHLNRGLRGQIPDTPKEEDKIFQRVRHVLFGNNLLALRAAKARAEALGFPTLILTSRWAGDTHEAARAHGAIIREVLTSHHPLAPPCCILSGGETTLKVTGTGKGGRNTEMALVLAREIAGLTGVRAVCLATDGTDGPTDAAGAWVSGKTCDQARRLGLSPAAFLERNDSYSFFQALKQLILTGPTRSNVMDVRIILFPAKAIFGIAPKSRTTLKSRPRSPL
jgi:hydroxypyruvate reductase